MACHMQVSWPHGDAHCYQILPRIGRGMARDLPRRARLIADGGYAARVLLIVPRSIVHNRRQRRQIEDYVLSVCK